MSGARPVTRPAPAGHPPRAVPVVLALLVWLVLPASAGAHAQLQAAVPAGGSIVREAPRQVEFDFSEAVSGSDDALRVYAPSGERVDQGAPFHPAGAPDRFAVRVRGDLRQGSYTATYRVISADGHPVSNGVVFSIGRPSATRTSLAGAVAGAQSGPVTRTTFGVVRALQYGAIAVGVGGLLFALLVLRPVAALGPAARRRTRTLVVGAAFVGALTAALGVVLEGAEGTGASLWSALRSEAVGDSLATRFGTVWAVAAGAWLVVGVGAALLLRDDVPATGRRTGAPAGPRGAARPGGSAAARGAARPGGSATARGAARPVGTARGAARPTGSVAAPGVSHPRGTTALAILVGAASTFLVVHPSLAGHAATQSPRAVLFASISVHVLAMAVWVGGIAALLLVVPAALRDAPADDGRLAAIARRFSRLAVWAVAAVALTGAIQGYVLVRTPDALVTTAHGRAVLIKTVLLVAIAVVATRNHRVSVPRLRAGDADGPRALRRLVRAEAALLVAVLAVTGALSTYQPAIAIPPGPVRATATLGPLRAGLTVTPARAGVNAMRIELRDPRTGRPFTGAREVELTETLPGRGVADLQQTATRSPAEPGVFLVDGAPLTQRGTWRVALTVRVSEFDQYDTHVDVRVRP